MIRLVLADDHAIVRDGVRRLVATQPDLVVVAECADGEAVLARLDDTPCDVLVLDLSLPGPSGPDLVRRAVGHRRRVGVVVLSMYPEDALALHLLHAGAGAYLCKDRSPEELLRAIRQVAAGRRYVTETLTDLAVAHPELRAPPHERLSSREWQVFLMVLDGRRLTEIADELGLSASTVANHVAAIKEKLGVSSIAEIVRYAHRAGLLG